MQTLLGVHIGFTRDHLLVTASIRNRNSRTICVSEGLQEPNPLFRDIGHYLAAATTSQTNGSAQMAAFSGQQAALDGDQRRFEEIARVGRREVA